MDKKTAFSKKLNIGSFEVMHAEYSRTHVCDASTGVDSSRFLYVAHGSATARIYTEEYRLEEGEVYYIPEGTKYRILWSGAPDIEYYALLLYSFGAPIESAERYAFTHINGSVLPDAEATFTRVFSLMESGEKTRAAEALSLYFSIYAAACPHISRERKKPRHAALTRALKYIEENYRSECTTAELAAACYISESRLYHLFSEELGITPVKYRNELRVLHATEALKTTEKTLEEISAECGFNSVTYFRETFKKYTDLTPTEYKKTLLRD